MSFHRYHAGLIVLAVVLALASVANAADDVKKKKGWTPGYNDPSIGTLGAPKTEGGRPINRNAAPPAPSAAPAVPKVDAGAATISGPASVDFGAAPRPEAQVEGGSGNSSGADTQRSTMFQSSVAQPQQVNTFLANHLVISGLIAGLIGTDLGSIIYGGPMMGNETAAMVGFVTRVALVLLIAILSVRLIWGWIGGSSKENDYLPAVGPRREPSFGRSKEVFEGRREPSFERPKGGLRPGQRDEPSSRRR
ncbi:hypothetical protein [Telmatospirillum sp.]|uniref:hypothetical protein n=1 Tax=Telmatospirillum sp. TaxID=2079197 RepID=UPI00283F0976|nr:hypothetical protein [Telmatospirillum sp.]MDR3439746.1 hypothetical protein [Telmatospirillum sp.]